MEIATNIMKGVSITNAARFVASRAGSIAARVGLQAAAEAGLEMAVTALAELAAPGVGGAVVEAGGTIAGITALGEAAVVVVVVGGYATFAAAGLYHVTQYGKDPAYTHAYHQTIGATRKSATEQFAGPRF